MKKVLGWLTGDLVGALGTALDGLFTSDDERAAAKNKILKTVLEKQHELVALQASIITAEAKGNWLQRSWRPILMLSFGFIVVYSKFIAHAFGLPNAELEPDFWELLRLGIGGYVIGRSAEKITDKINLKLKQK